MGPSWIPNSRTTCGSWTPARLLLTGVVVAAGWGAVIGLLTQDPRYMLLDEPTNHLDQHHQIEVLQVLARLLLEDGRHGAGPAVEWLTTEHLSQLYGHPMQQITGQPRPVWMPA